MKRSKIVAYSASLDELRARMSSGILTKEHAILIWCSLLEMTTLRQCLNGTQR